MSKLYLSWVGCLALCMGACAGEAGNVAGSALTLELVEQEIGPEGGELRTPDGASLVIPPGALGSNVNFQIGPQAALEEWKDDHALLPFAQRTEGVTHVFRPYNTYFRVPATLTMPCNAADTTVQVMTRREEGDRTWGKVDSSTCGSDGLVSLESNRLGLFLPSSANYLSNHPIADLDGDGVSNVDELSRGLDPVKPGDTTSLDESEYTRYGCDDAERDDWDGDGICDSFEYLFYPQLDDRSRDTNNNGVPDGLDDPDGDGLSTEEEATMRLNPFLADTDGDGVLDPMEDRDGDGLTVMQELNSGTSDRLLDSDGDRIADGAEIQAGLNPNSKDSDDDGVEDLVERILELDPLVADSDGDGTADAMDDPDGDGLASYQELALSLDWTRKDSDGDSIDDLDEDYDNDTLSSREEIYGLEGHSLQTINALRDTDRDRIPDILDADDDGDGLLTADEVASGRAIGALDLDGDGRVQWLDTDSDGDRISDENEPSRDADGDGILAYLDADENCDGSKDQLVALLVQMRDTRDVARAMGFLNSWDADWTMPAYYAYGFNNACMEGLDLSGVAFRGVSLRNVKAAGTNFSGASFALDDSWTPRRSSSGYRPTISGDFENADFSNVNMQAERIYMSGNFENANLSSMSLQSSQSVSFGSLGLEGINLENMSIDSPSIGGQWNLCGDESVAPDIALVGQSSGMTLSCTPPPPNDGGAAA